MNISLNNSSSFGSNFDPNNLGMSLQGGKITNLQQTGAPIQGGNQPIIQQSSGSIGPKAPNTKIQTIQNQINQPISLPPPPINKMIAQAREMGAQDEDILAEILKQNTGSQGFLSTVSQAKNMGASASDILQEISNQNKIADTPQSKPYETTYKKSEDLGSDVIDNTLNEVASRATGLGRAIVHPIDTLKGIGNLIASAVLPKTAGFEGEEVGMDQSQIEGSFQELYPNAANTQRAIAKTFLGGATDVTPATPIKESLSRVKDQAIHNPVGFLSDTSLVSQVAGQGLGSIGKLSKSSSLSKAGEGLTALGRELNPTVRVSEVLPKSLAIKLEKSNLKLTPTEKRKLGPKYTKTVDYVVKNIPAGTAKGRLNKAGQMAEVAEDAYQDAIKGQAVIPKTQIIDELKKIPEQFKNDLGSYEIAKNRTNAIVEALDDHPNAIPIETVNLFKRGQWNKSFTDLGILKSNKEIEKALGSAFQKTVEEAAARINTQVIVPEELISAFGARKLPIGKYNQQYGQLLSAKDILERVADRNQLGVFGRATAAYAGNQLGRATAGEPGALIGTAVMEGLANNVATPVRSTLSKIVQGKPTQQSMLGKAALINPEWVNLLNQE